MARARWLAVVLAWAWCGGLRADGPEAFLFTHVSERVSGSLFLANLSPEALKKLKLGGVQEIRFGEKPLPQIVLTVEETDSPADGYRGFRTVSSEPPGCDLVLVMRAAAVSPLGVVVSGSLSSPGHAPFSLRDVWKQERSYRIQKVARSTTPEPPRAGRLLPKPTEPARPGTGPIEVLVTYTRGVLTDEMGTFTGETPAEQAVLAHQRLSDLAATAIQDGTSAFKASGITHKLHLARCAPVVGETGAPLPIESLLDLLVSTERVPPLKREVDGIRNDPSVKADLVCLIAQGRGADSGGADSDGIGETMLEANPAFEKFAYSVVRRMALEGGYTLLHELGHNLGCCHAEDDPNPIKDCQGHAHGFKFRARPSASEAEIPYLTMMSTTGGERILRFSNPAKHYPDARGPAIGSNEANNAAVINASGGVVAGFRR